MNRRDTVLALGITSRRSLRLGVLLTLPSLSTAAAGQVRASGDAQMLLARDG